MAKKVTIIPATLNKYSKTPINVQKKRLVAGYGRVSTDALEQQSSYEAQVDYYTEYINSREDWEFVGMYADEGITGTSTKKRKGFNDMVQDALDGKIDLIITKSISRFARNTVDSLVTVRKLKEKGVEIYFEKENIWTLDSKGELLITIMSSLAQEESRSISENTTWGKRKSFADGKVSVAYSTFLGYDRGENGEFVINAEQAKVVELIYKFFIEGYSTYKIAQMLTSMGISTPRKKKKWYQSTVASILTNEKYKGDALLQKYYTEDFLTKKRKKNNGEIPQYYVEGHHPAIISPETFELVQAEMRRRKRIQGKYSSVGIFSSKIKCGECGAWYGPKTWHSTDKYRKVVYLCNHKYSGGRKCTTPHLAEEEIKSLFIRAVNKVFTEKNEIVGNVKLMMRTLCDTSILERELEELESKMEMLAGIMGNIVAENASAAMDQEEYQKRYDSLYIKYDETRWHHSEVVGKIADKQAQAAQFQDFISTMVKMDGVYNSFDVGLWSSLVDYVTVNSKEDIRFTFKGGMEIII